MSQYRDEQDDELEDELEDLSGTEAPLFISLHHHIPMTFGTLTRDGLLLPELPRLDPQRAQKPPSPGMPPIYMPAPFDPDSLRLLPPPGVNVPGRNIPAPRIRLGSVARSPFASPADAVPVPTPIIAPAAPQPQGDAAIIETPARPSWGERVDPLVAFLFYLALGAGIALSGIDTLIRYTVLWTVLIGLGAAILYVNASRPIEPMSSNDILWGFGFGFILGLPLLVAAGQGLIATTGALFPELLEAPRFAQAVVILFQSWVLVGPLAETLFFRGAIQDRRGMAASITAAGANNILLFLPIAFKSGSVLAGAAIFYMTALAAVYSFVRRRYGLTAALICQITVNIMLLFIPGINAVIFAARTP